MGGGGGGGGVSYTSMIYIHTYIPVHTYIHNMHIGVVHDLVSVVSLQKLLSFQSKDASEISPITVEALQYRINPCLHETEKQTVESLLYIPPSGELGRERESDG